MTQRMKWIAAAAAMSFSVSAPAAGPDVGFRMHTINADSRFEACGVFDVNRDGRLDILCGGFWYELPTWKRHIVRDVKEQDNYYYDFSNLPLDVNGDGWTDFVSVAWHNETIIWVENPGTRGGKWPEHFIDKPGHLETALLCDLDGDRDMDVLPNVMEQVIWYEFVRPAGRGTTTQPAEGATGAPFRPRPLGKAGAGAGIGFGDVNRDRRVDILCAKGWYEAPADRRSNTWQWHAEWDLGDASIPILAYDVDGDADTDVVWGIGHDYGLYWLEQQTDADGKRTWTRHEIDRSWSQAHFLARADIDGDEQPDVVTGKRYYAHNGRDPGANDPRCIYWYAFDRSARKWIRHTVAEGGPAGFGISAVAADIDRDGDIDLVTPGKSGLYLFENLRRAPRQPAPPQQAHTGGPR